MPYKDPEKQKQAQHESYIRNKKKNVEKAKKWRQKLLAQVRELMTPCADCGAFDTRYMDWHHPDPSNKTAAVSTLVHQVGKWSLIKAEIDKCVCLCANCHRIRHAGH